jgi:hypothetical protein
VYTERPAFEYGEVAMRYHRTNTVETVRTFIASRQRLQYEAVLPAIKTIAKQCNAGETNDEHRSEPFVSRMLVNSDRCIVSPSRLSSEYERDTLECTG